MARELNSAETFPPGTEVAVYHADDWSTSNIESSTPPDNDLTSVTVPESGVLSVDVPDGERYIAIGVVAGRRRFLRFKG